MIPLIAVAVAFCALGFTLLSLRHAQEKIEALESDIDAVEGHNRTLQEQRDALKSSLAEASAALETAKKRVETLETENQELEQQRAALAETAARLEKLRAELEGELGKLRREHESLERRVVDFQGQWSHQLNTLEAEISTLIRQLGEFRKGTQLPIPKAEGAAPGVSTIGAAVSLPKGEGRKAIAISDPTVARPLR
jgi:chromosome segregation ATPase